MAKNEPQTSENWAQTNWSYSDWNRMSFDKRGIWEKATRCKMPFRDLNYKNDVLTSDCVLVGTQEPGQ